MRFDPVDIDIVDNTRLLYCIFFNNEDTDNVN